MNALPSHPLVPYLCARNLPRKHEIVEVCIVNQLKLHPLSGGIGGRLFCAGVGVSECTRKSVSNQQQHEHQLQAASRRTVENETIGYGDDNAKDLSMKQSEEQQRIRLAAASKHKQANGSEEEQENEEEDEDKTQECVYADRAVFITRSKDRIGEKRRRVRR